MVLYRPSCLYSALICHYCCLYCYIHVISMKYQKHNNNIIMYDHILISFRCFILTEPSCDMCSIWVEKCNIVRLDRVSYAWAQYNALTLVSRNRYIKMDRLQKITEINSLICKIILSNAFLPSKNCQIFSNTDGGIGKF